MTVPSDIAAGRLRWASEPRLGSDLNEDRVGMAGNAVWVLDGAGTPSGVSACCDKDATWYVDHLNAALAAVLETGEEFPLSGVLANAIADVREQHATGCHDASAGRGPSSTIAIARRRDRWLDLLVLGDSTILLDHGTHTTAMRDRRLAEIAPDLRQEIKTAIAHGRGYENAEHSLRRSRLVQLERERRNREGGYWIAADDPAVAGHALVQSVPIGSTSSSVRAVALMSDGAERATAVFGLYASDRELLDAAGVQGPKSCINRVRTAETDDPSGQRHPRTKRSDDASFVVWELWPELSPPGTSAWVEQAGRDDGVEGRHPRA